MTDVHMLTTADNPFSPVTEYDDWLSFDEDAGYFTNGLLARVTRSSDELSETDQDLAIEQAIDEIITENRPGFYKKVLVGASQFPLIPGT